jgi:hypothetical protein
MPTSLQKVESWGNCGRIRPCLSRLSLARFWPRLSFLLEVLHHCRELDQPIAGGFPAWNDTGLEKSS